ncbi:hypothetical protein [Spiroplasma endosymbiont of Andrena trimmerana]|uniref:hypothetical protein n=1 Tax=Spiroplasma endosymbiont of Andrena trimmerana TaxID=3066316 RepID=UPI0030D5A54B
MKNCPYKYEKYNFNVNCNYNNSINYCSEIKNKSFICSNCLNKQLISSNYVYIGYCNNNYEVHNKDLCGKLIDNDEISFVCSYRSCGKISFNILSGKPMYNIAVLNNKSLEVLDILKQKKQDILFSLLKEYFFALKLKLNSCATLLARKLLIHFACELGCKYKRDEKFPYYVNHIKESQLLGKNWASKLDLVKNLGNNENHQLKVATDKELSIVKFVMEELINSHFLVENL